MHTLRKFDYVYIFQVLCRFSKEQILGPFFERPPSIAGVAGAVVTPLIKVNEHITNELCNVLIYSA